MYVDHYNSINEAFWIIGNVATDNCAVSSQHPMTRVSTFAGMVYTACGTDRNLKLIINGESLWQRLLENHYHKPKTCHLEDSLLKKVRAAAKRKAPVAEGLEKVNIVTSSQCMTNPAH